MKKTRCALTAAFMAVMILLMGITTSGAILPESNIAISNYTSSKDFLVKNMDEIFEHILNGGANFSKLAIDFGSSKISNSFRIYDVDNVDDYEDVEYFPVIKNNSEVIAVLAVHNSGNGYSCIVNTSLGEIVDELSNKDALLVRKGMNLYSYDSNTIQTLVENDSDLTISLNEIPTEVVSNYCSVADAVQLDNSYIDCSKYAIASKSTRSDSGSLSNYSVVGQGSYSICWAACIASMYNYLNGYTYSATSLIDSYPDKNLYIYEYSGSSTPPATVYYRAATYSNIRQHIFRYYFSNALSYLNAVTISTIKNTIDSGEPLYISSEASSETDYDDEYYHAVVVYGYSLSNSTYSIYIMDPYSNSGSGGYVVGIYENSAPAYYSLGGTGRTMYFRRALAPNEN